MTSGNLPSKSQIFISKVNCSVSHFLFFLTFVLSTMSPPNSTDGTDMINEDNGSVVFVSNKVTIEETIRNEQKKAGASVQCQTEQMKHMSLNAEVSLYSRPKSSGAEEIRGICPKSNGTDESHVAGVSRRQVFVLEFRVVTCCSGGPHEDGTSRLKADKRGS
jgi:hypothetical protein